MVNYPKPEKENLEEEKKISLVIRCYNCIIKYRSYLYILAGVFIILAFKINYNQRIGTLGVIASDHQTIAKIDKTTTALLDMAIESKKSQDSLKVVVNHIPTGAPLRIKDITRVSSNYGYRYDPVRKLWAFHGAKDFAVSADAIIYATASGIVVKAQMNESLGKYITIDHGNGYTTTYAHLSRIDALPGYIIKKGNPIAVAGNTGWSTGRHLHYVIDYLGESIDPDKLMQL